jgi:sortase A
VTALDARTETARPTDAPARREQPPTGSHRKTAARHVIGIAACALVLLGLAWAVFVVFEGPVARTWNTVRQHRLASQLSVPGLHRTNGSAIAVLQIPRLGTNVVIAEGDTPQQLRAGPGHRVGTSIPGDKGNSVVLGHHSGWGGGLRDVASLKRGDYIVVQTQTSNGLKRNAVFTVQSVERVGARDVAPFATASDRRLTLITGTGGQFSEDRLVVTAVSGPVRKVGPVPPGTAATSSAGSLLWNAQGLLVVGGLGGALLLALVLRRRYHLGAVLAVVSPLVVLGLLGLLLDIDAALPALR